MDIPNKFNFAKYIFEKKLGDKIAVIDNTSSISYQELEQRSRGFTKSLTNLGLTREDRVLILAPDGIEFVISVLGCILGGFVPVIGNPWASKKNICDYIESSVPKVIIFENNRNAKSLSIEQCLSNTTHKPKNIINFTNINQMSKPSDYDPPTTLRDSDAFWVFTSGSTGENKIVVHSHQSMIGVATHYGVAVDYQPTDIVFSTSKLFFVWGLGSSVINTLSIGATSILHDKLFTPSIAATIFKKYQPTIFVSVPSFYVGLINSDIELSYASLRLCFSAGEATPASVQTIWQQKTNLIINDHYGSTEVLAPVVINNHLVPGFEGQVRNAQDNVVMDQVGDFYVKGPSMALRYQNNTEQSRATFIGEWCKTGDKFIQHNDTYQFVGRSKDMLKINARWVSPIEIENVLLSHRLVDEVGVTGVENSDGLTEIVAYVVIDPTAKIPDNLDYQLKSEVKHTLEYYKCPKYIRILNQLPKNTNGKIQRYLLNKTYDEQLN